MMIDGASAGHLTDNEEQPTVDSPAVTAIDVLQAAATIANAAVRTPLLEYRCLNDRCGRRVLVKFEGAQHTGSFKFRGAFNRLSHLTPEQRSNGVVAYSSGNHGQAIAAVARLLGIPAAIVMPADAPGIKIESTRAHGADVVLYDRYSQSREDIAKNLARSRSALLVGSFDDPYVIAGQGTIGAEIMDQTKAVNAVPAQLLAACGGGGLVAGIATIVKANDPRIEVYCVEPEGFDDTARSLASGRREQVAQGQTSICDALLLPSPGEITFPIMKALLSGGLVVSDDEVRSAVRYAFEKLKLVVEPGGAVSLAALLAGRVPASDGDAVIVLSGSNIDPELFSSIISNKDRSSPCLS